METSVNITEVNGARYLRGFVADAAALYRSLVTEVDWDDRMVARKTASYGKAYNYSQMAYPDRPFPRSLEIIRRQLIPELGDARVLRFKRILDPEQIVDLLLEPGSLFYMDQQVQESWLHAIPRSDSAAGRISLTFRRLI